MEFRDAVWGTGLDSLQQQQQVEEDDDPIEDVDLLPDQHSHTCCVAVPKTLPDGWRFGPQWILVWSKYLKAKQAAVLSSKSNCNMLVVAGQPGIGLSPFSFTAHRI